MSNCVEYAPHTRFLCRFLDVTLTARHNITSGKIYKEVCGLFEMFFGVGSWSDSYFLVIR